MLSSDSDIHDPQSSASTQIPKIQTESKNDILFLQNQLRAFIDTYIADNETALLTHRTIGNDGPKEQIVDRMTEKQKKRYLVKLKDTMEEWLTKTFDLAAPNISINGMDYANAFKKEEEFHPVDPSLLIRATQLSNELEEISLRVTKNRKIWASQVCMLSEDVVRRESEIIDRDISEDLGATVGENTDSSKVEIGKNTSEKAPLNIRPPDLKELEKTLSLIKGLNSTLPHNISKLERAQTILEEEMRA